MDVGQHVLENTIGVFKNYKSLAEKAFEQLTHDVNFHYQPDPESNSIAIIVQHISGNMISRWTDFLTTDGEKPDRNRDKEFEENKFNKQELLQIWDKGWNVFFKTLDSFTQADLLKIVTIRNEELTVYQALNRQTAHYAYHIGQIVFLAKHIQSANWRSLSIAKSKSTEHLKGNYLNNLK